MRIPSAMPAGARKAHRCSKALAVLVQLLEAERQVVVTDSAYWEEE